MCFITNILKVNFEMRFYQISQVCFMPFHVGYHKHCHYQSVPDRGTLLWFLLFAAEGQSF